MPIRGETVGTAFVRILADGSEVGDSITDQMRENEDAFAAQGSRDSKAYQKAFSEELDQPSRESIRTALARSIAEADISREFFEGNTWKEFVHNMEVRFGAVGRRAAVNLENDFRKAGSLDGIVEEIEHILPRIVQATEQIRLEEERATKAVDKHREAMDDDTESTRRNIREVDHHVHVLRRAANAFDRLAEPVGRLLGRGSRNNFLNFFGSVITNVLKLGKVVVTVFDGIISFVGKASNALFGFNEELNAGAVAATKLSGAVAAGSTEVAATTVATGGLNIAIAFAAAAAAFALAGLAAGTLISALILLSGVVISLAGTIEFALIGAVAALAPLLVPLAAIIGGVVAAVFKFKDAGDKLSAAMDRVKNKAKKMFDIFSDNAFKRISKLTNEVAHNMRAFDPIMARAGRGFNRFAGKIVDALTSPAIVAFSDRFAKFLPHAMSTLGDIFANTFKGLAGILRASITPANELLGWLDKITGNFAEWANSGKGQAEIKSFLRRASDSAKALWHFLSEAFGLLQDFLTAGHGRGDDLFTKMGDSLERIRTFLRDNPDALKNFFKDSKHFGEELGTTIEKISKALDKIDTPQSRHAAKQIIKLLGDIVTAIGFVIAAFEGGAGLIRDAMALWFKFVRAGVFLILDGFGLIIDSAAHVATAIGGPQAAAAAQRAAAAYRKFADHAKSDINGIGEAAGLLTEQINKANPTYNINTDGAVAKLNFLQQLINGINLAIARANATHISPNAVEHGVGSGNPPPPPDEDLPNSHAGTRSGRRGTGVHITVNSPQADPRAVAAETMNRLVAMGY